MLKECCFCGATFEVEKGYRKMCPECQEIVLHNKGRHCAYRYDGPKNTELYEWELRRRNIREHNDTIVAEGYADRQVEKILANVSKIKVTL